MAEERAVGTPVLRRLNTAAVLRAVRDCAPEPVRLAELVRLTGLTRPTVGQAVDGLVEAGWLQQHDPAAASPQGGRPAVRVSLRGRAAPVLGLDVGPHTVSAGIDDLAAHRLAAVRLPVGRTGAGRLLGVVDEAVGRALAEAGLGADEIAAVVVATPGIVDPASGRILLAPSVPGWTSVNLSEHLRGRFGCPVQVENDANLAALAVAGERSGAGTLLAVQWGERLGAGVVIGGRLHRGTGSAGEIGFIRPPGDVPDTGDGRGPLERAIGAEAITERARRAARDRPGTALQAGGLDAAAVFAAAAAGDEAAVRVVDEVAASFAQAIAPAVLVLAPDAVVIGGGVARAGSVLLTAITRHLGRLTLTPPVVEFSGLAEDTVLTGALRLALDEVWGRLPV
ncbi:ROK family transcriptional regulator [Actinomadura montaniterrae]|uniref:ROK family transcriptional regulator n=1 Tax=Actinomadura montaniterrae TaxID=1803903 RepID=A0A6L3VRB5_9ACTN|nr:ROK family transcriptional regulator [Actinomadura montaniterrae]KAB2379339.1 ROK family transcriptional regulator [Actinomadura montaniterrae]